MKKIYMQCFWGEIRKLCKAFSFKSQSKNFAKILNQGLKQITILRIEK